MSGKTETKGIAPKIANGFQKKGNQAIYVRTLLLSITESGTHWQTGREFMMSAIKSFAEVLEIGGLSFEKAVEYASEIKESLPCNLFYNYIVRIA